MQITPTAIPDVKLITPRKHGDHRGFFSETYSRKALAAAGIDVEFVQDNHSMSSQSSTVRGLHYQIGAAAQAKLVRVVRGAIFDVAVDIRRGSPTFGKHVIVELSETNWQQLYVPVGFAHGFVTIDTSTEVIYKVTNYYSPTDERGILWNDPALGIDWRVIPGEETLSDRDRKHPALAQATDLF